MNTIVETINAAGRAFVDFSIPMLIQSSVLILILLAVDAILRGKVRAVFRYWIWLLVLVKLVLPPSLGSPISIGTWLGDRLEVPIASLVEPEPMPVPDLEPQGQEPSPIVSDIVAPSDSMIAQPGVLPRASMPAPTEVQTTVVSLSWQGFVLLAWSAVVIALSLLLVQRAFFVRGLVAQAEETNREMLSELEDCRRRLGLHGRIGLRLSPNATSPAVCGLVHPMILVPQSLAPKLHSHNLQAVLLHELAHVQRGDLWINLAQTLLQIAYFYNPLLWLANAMIRRTREQAVDETVLVAMGETARQYPEILVNIAKLAFTRRPALSLRLIGVVESKSALTARIKHILSRPIPKTARLGVIGLLTIVVIAAVLLPMAAGRSTVGRPDGSGERQSAFVETLSNGAVVELLGVCEYPSPDRQWWRPDGSLMERAPYKTTGNERQQEAGFKDYELVVRYTGAPDMSIEWDVPGSRNSGITGSPLGEDDRRIWDLTVNTVRFPEDQASATVRVAAAAGPWKTRAVHKTLDREGAYSLDAGKAVTFGIAHMQTNDMLVPVTVNLSRHDMAFRVVAVRGRDEICEGGLSGVGGDELNSLTYRFNCPLSDMKEFRFQTRPWTWVEFEDVSLRPGQKVVSGERPRVGARVVGIGPAWEALRDAVGTRYRGTIGGFGREERRSAEYLDKVLSWTKPGDAFVLMLAFDESPVVPERYRDLLLLPWSEIESRVRRGESVEAHGKARDLDVIVLAAATSEQLNTLVRKTSLLDAYRGGTLKEIVLPEAGKQPVVLDLATGELVPLPPVGPEPQKIQQALKDLGKGDVLYDVDLGDRSLILLRGAVSEQVQEDTGEPGVKGHFVGDSLPEVLTVTTAEGRRYEVTILSAADEGCALKYSLVALDKGADGGALAEPATTDVKPSDSGPIARLANGVTITLLAYSQLGEKGLEWWTPQGERTTIPGVYEADVEGHGSILALRAEPTPEAGVFAWSCQLPDVKKELKPVWRVGDTDIWLVPLGEGRNYVNVEIMAQVRDPVVAKAVTREGFSLPVGFEVDQRDISRIFAVNHIDSDWTAFSAPAGPDAPAVVAALDISGQVHSLRRPRTNEFQQIYGAQFSGRGRWETDIPLDRFAGVVVEGYRERAGLMKLGNLSLRPGQPTQVRVEAEPEQRGPWWHRSEYDFKLDDLGRRLLEHAKTHGGSYPADESTLHTLCHDELWQWLQGHVVYLGAGKTSTVPAGTVLAYVKTLLPFGFGTYVFYADGNVEFVVPSKLRTLGISTGDDRRTQGNPDAKQKMNQLALAISGFADSHQGNLPATLSALSPYLGDPQALAWLDENVTYVGKGSVNRRRGGSIVTAFEKVPRPTGERYVLFLDYHIELAGLQRLAELNLENAGQANDGRLEFRIAANLASLDSAAIERYQRALVNGNSPPEADFAWFPSRVSTTGSPEVLAQEHGGTTYVLLWNKVPHVILASQDWGLDKVYRTTDAMGRPAIGLTLNDKGAALFHDITTANVGRPLAILVDGEVVSMPHIMLPLDGRSALITGNFTEREVADMIAALRKGMEATRPPVEPGEKSDAGEETPFSIHGTVTDQSGRPMAGVEIAASCGVGTLLPTGRTVTDEAGRYTLYFKPGFVGHEVLLQAATISARKPGFYEANLYRQGNLAMAGKPPRPEDVAHYAGVVLPDQPYELNFTMRPAARIEGELVDERGKPLSAQTLWLNGNERYPSTSVLATIQTDETGRFTVESVPLEAVWFEGPRPSRVQSDSIDLAIPGKWQVKLECPSDGARITIANVQPPAPTVHSIPLGRYALSFDGIDDCLIAPASASLALKQSFFIEVWARPDYSALSASRANARTEWLGMNLIRQGRELRSATRTVASGAPQSGGFVGFVRGDTGGFFAVQEDGRAAQTTIFRTNQLAVDRPDWRHFYVSQDDAPQYMPSNGPLVIGGGALMPDGFAFKGEIAEIRIWNGVPRVRDTRYVGTTSVTGNEPNLVACWTFEESSGQIVHDISRNGNHARLGNSGDADDADPTWIDLMQTDPVAARADVTLTLGGDDPLGLFYNEHGLWFELDNRGSDSVEINPHPLDQDADRRGEWGYVEVLAEDGTSVTYKWRDSPPSVHRIPPGKRYKVQDFLNGMPLRESGPGVYKVRLTLRVRNVRTDEATFIPSNWHTFHVTPAGRWPDQVRGPYVELREAEAFAATCNYGHGSHDEAIRRLLALAEKYAGTKYALEAYFTAADQANAASYEPGDLAAYQAKRREYHREIVKRWPDVVNHYTIYARLHTHFGMPESEFIQSRRETYRWLLSVTEEQKIASIRAYGAFAVQLSDEPTDEDVRRSLASLNQYISQTKQMLETSSPDIAADASKSEAASEDDESTLDGVSGRVVDPNGQPVAGAQVALCSKDKGVIVQAGRLVPTTWGNKNSEIVQTDAQGRFSFASAPEEFHLIAAHDEGFVWVTAEEFRAAADLRLAPWARIEGTLRIAQAVGADERVELFNYINKNAIDQNVHFDYQSQTDAAGRFAFTKVPPTWMEVGYLIRTGESISTHTCRTPIHLEPGQNMQMNLGGQGRPVVGRFVPPADYQGPVHFGAGLRAFSTLPPERPQPDNYDQMTKRQQADWYDQWRKTPEAQAYYDAMWHDLNRRHYAFRIQDDGSFRIEDVMPGQYEFTVWLEEQLTGQGRQEEIGGYYGTAQVPAMTQAYTEEPLNLGDLTLSMRNPPLRVGDVAPLFEAKTLDGKDIRLADYRGQFVLLSFWQPTFHPELDRLKELYKAYGTDGRLAILEFAGNDTLEEVKKYIAEHRIEWPEVYLGEKRDSDIAKRYGDPVASYILLVDPEGKIVATWLREEKLTDTVRDAITAADSAKSVSTSPGSGEGRRRR